MDLYGIPVITSKCCTIPIEIRNHKKKRINKKLCKRYGQKFTHIPDPKVFIIECPKRIIGHPTTIKKLVKEMKNEERRFK